MKKTSIKIMALLFAAGSIQADIVTFENGSNGVSVVDNMAITDQYLADAGVKFRTGVYGDKNYGSYTGSAFIEQTGQQAGVGEGNGSANSGFGYTPDAGGANWVDTVSPINGGMDGLNQATRTALLGNYFLRTAGYSRDSLTVQYSTAVEAASFEIWDLDGGNATTAERWKITAYNGDWLTPVISQQTPLVANNIDTTSYDGQAYIVTLSGVNFDRFVLEFTGTKTSAVGLAFNNFNTTQIPEPAAMSMMAVVIGAAMWIRRRFID